MRKCICLLLVLFVSQILAWQGEHKKAKRELSAGNFSVAEAIYREILSSEPGDVDALTGLSYVLIKRRNFVEAYETALKVLEKDPLNARANALVATALLRSGHFGFAYQYLQVALSQPKRDALALASAAEIDLYENRTSEAYDKLRLATYFEPEEADFWLLYARAASRLDYYRDAAEALERFLRYSPKTDKDRRERIEGVIKFYKHLGNSNIYKISGKAAVVAFNLKGRRPHLEVKVNNRTGVRFVIDTGAGVTVISETAAKRLGVREVARGGNAYAVGGTGSFPIVYGVIDELVIGEVRIRTVPVYIRQIYTSATSPEDTVDGYIGVAVLSNFLTTIDYLENKLVIEKRDSKNALTAADDDSVMPFRLTESGLISVEVRLEDEASCNFLLDSGASSSVISEEVINKQNWHDKVLVNESIKIVGAAGISENVKIAFLKKLQLADLVRERIRMPVLALSMLNEGAGFEQQGILGGDFLTNCRLRIDFDSLRIFIKIAPNRALKRVSVADNAREGDF
ncbi:MAG: aspartyl protease family protein [Acidobacteriota bacterium]|nr:aspartyl protease family protein [Blastocatellia bacterium]MDW8413400.1 aspartyl protease family protein [Acidobacteriota bacterium]